MRVKVRLYSILREEAGSPEVELDLPDNAVVSDLLQALARRAPNSVRALEGSLRVIADGRVLGRDDPIPNTAAAIHVLPPSSGGSGAVGVRVLSSEPLDIGEVVRFLEGDERVGALAIFIGVVRGVNKGERVSELRYEHAEGLLEGSLRQIGEEAIRAFGLSKVFIAHYVGPRRPGDLTMVVGVAAEGRDRAFPALAWIVDRVKHEAPIWKEEVRESGRYFILGEGEVKAPEASQSRA